MSSRFYTYILFLFAFLLFTSCSNNYYDRVEMGQNKASDLGEPDISVVVSSLIDENNTPHIMVITEIEVSSLIFKMQEREIQNASEVEIEIRNAETEALEAKRRYPVNLVQHDPNEVFNYKVHKLEKRLQVKPGSYIVNVVVTDLNSTKDTSVETKIEVPDPEEQITHLTNIRTYGKSHPDSAFISQNSYDLSADTDSLKFIFQVTNTETGEPMVIESELLRFQADTTIPRRMSGRDYRSTSLEYLGIDYREFEVVQRNRRTLTETGSVIIEFVYTNLDKGNYRFVAKTENADSENLYRARDFSIKSEHYPAIRTPREMAKPLVYLMREDEHKEMLSIEDPDSLKVAIDQYWLGNIQNAAKARQIIELYYDRVEQANVQFSNFKEGWKTDPGMIYILFGPPNYVDYGFGYMTWFYNFDSGNRSPSITFQDVRYGNNLFPFEHYILNRDPSLHGIEYRQIQAWNDGSILFLNQ